MKPYAMPDPSRQRGTALVIGLVMMAMLMVVVISSYKTTRISLDIVNNMQISGQSIAAANATIEEAISTVRMFQTPNTVFLDPCAGNNTRCFDINSDGVDDITVTLTAPFCVLSQNLRNAALDLNDPDVDYRGCAVGTSQSFGVAGSNTGDSLCSETMWQLTATSQDVITGASQSVTSGAKILVSIDDVLTSCI